MFANKVSHLSLLIGSALVVASLADPAFAWPKRGSENIDSGIPRACEARPAPNVFAIEHAFSPFPQGQAIRLVEKAIDAATKTIEVAAYEMTSKPIADALICAAQQRGVQVFVVVDAKENHHGDGKSKIDYLIDGGVKVKIDANYPIMHNKFIVVDGIHLETGSFNYTYAAEARNAENVMVIWNNAQLANEYATEFYRLWQESAD